MDASQILKNIRDRSYLNLKLINQVRPTLPLPRPSSLTLPNPKPIVHQLLRIERNHALVERLSNAYIDHAKQLKVDYERNLNKVVDSYAGLGQETRDLHKETSFVLATYTTMYQRTLNQWLDSIVHLLTQKGVSYPSSGAPNKLEGLLSGHSRQDAYFVLENAFVVNPYPSRDEKLATARCTDMTYKQVHVWFQNRRNRSKREGKGIRRRTFVDENNRFSRGQPSGAKSRHRSSLAQIPSSEIVEEHSPTREQAPCPLQTKSAPHAFPNTFPPVCDYEPFPLLQGLQTFDTPWPRGASSQWCIKANDSVSADVEQLCDPLSRLTLTDERSPSSPKATRWARRSHDRVLACFPALVYPPTAPLPALVPALVTVHAVTRRGTSSPSLSNHVVRVPAPLGSPIGYSASKGSIDVSLRRIPQPLSRSARDSVHPYQPREPSKSKSRRPQLSRLSSVSSLSSLGSDDCCSSRASSASLESPPPTTPPQLPTALPGLIKISVPDTIFSSSQDINRLFADTGPLGDAFLVNPQLQVA